MLRHKDETCQSYDKSGEAMPLTKHMHTTTASYASPETHKFKVQDQQNQTDQYQCSTIVIPHLVFMFLEVNGKESAADTPIRIST